MFFTLLTILGIISLGVSILTNKDLKKRKEETEMFNKENNPITKKENKKLFMTFLGGFWTLCIVTTVLIALTEGASPALILIPCLLTLFALIIVGTFVLLGMILLKKNQPTTEK